MKFETKTVAAELVVVGAGMPGLCAALQAAREGVDVVLINDRGCVGGNCSAEINVTCGGAPDGNPLNINLREGGIVDELRVETAYRSPRRNRYAQDTVYLDAMRRESEHLRLYLNTCIDEVETGPDGRILSVSGTQNTTETRFTFKAPLFVDDTGDGALGALAGADFMIGREAKSTFNERIAPDEADSFVIPSTLTFFSHDVGEPTPFVAPDFAINIKESGALRYRTIPHDKFDFLWYYEGDGAMDQVKERETIIQNHQALVYGIWDHIKNSGEYPEAANYDLEFVGLIPGMREYRRLCGDKILIESDLVQQREFEDAVGHGGWNIDLHAIHGFFDDDLVNRHIHFRGAYQIPLRCGYSRNVSNLFMCGRCMSTSHVAFGSTRVAATLSTLGQAVGMAAALCKKYGVLPRGVCENHIKELQQRLLREDQLIPGLKNEDECDHALRAAVSASSEALLELTDASGETGLGDGLALELPLTGGASRIILSARSDADTRLSYAVYRPDRGYNFGPDHKIAAGEVDVRACAEFADVAIPLDGLTGGSYYTIELHANEHLTFACAPAPLPTTIMYSRYKNDASTNWQYDGMGMSDYCYARAENCLCYRFDVPQPAYAPANVVNGYNRACFGTNMWHSAAGDAHPSLTLRWDKPVPLSMLQITFGIDTTLKIYRFTGRVLKHLSTDYRVYGLLNGKETLLQEVHGNHSKRNRLRFDSALCDGVRFEFDKNQAGQVAVYEVRAES